MRITHLLVVLAPCLLCACIGGSKGTATSTVPPTPTVNTLAVVVDAGPVAAGGAINRPYVTVKVCVPGSTTCANVDHVLLDTGSWGLRLVRSVLTASGVTLTPSAGGAAGEVSEECATFSGGATWGPVALADVTLAGEVASKVPVQVLDDTNTGASPPAACSNNGSVHNQVTDLLANGILGVGVFAQDCGAACVSPTTPPNFYYGCAGTAPGVCTAENVALASQVTNPVALFAADNNGVIVNLLNLQNANGDATVTGEVIFGLGTQTDNALPATGLTVLGADPTTGDFTATYSATTVPGTTVLPALIDSGTDDYAFADTDPNMATCTATPPNNAAWVGYYCPIVAPQALSAVNTGATSAAVPSVISSPVPFAIADPNSFVATATAFINLGGGQGSTRFTWGMPFFYGRKIYVGIDQTMSGTLKGPFYAY
jgi:Protein of unknown function (DUF3443)